MTYRNDFNLVSSNTLKSLDLRKFLARTKRFFASFNDAPLSVNVTPHLTVAPFLARTHFLLYLERLPRRHCLKLQQILSTLFDSICILFTLMFMTMLINYQSQDNTNTLTMMSYTWPSSTCSSISASARTWWTQLDYNHYTNMLEFMRWFLKIKQTEVEIGNEKQWDVYTKRGRTTTTLIKQ